MIMSIERNKGKTKKESKWKWTERVGRKQTNRGEMANDMYWLYSLPLFALFLNQENEKNYDKYRL